MGSDHSCPECSSNCMPILFFMFAVRSSSLEIQPAFLILRPKMMRRLFDRMSGLNCVGGISGIMSAVAEPSNNYSLHRRSPPPGFHSDDLEGLPEEESDGIVGIAKARKMSANEQTALAAATFDERRALALRIKIGAIKMLSENLKDSYGNLHPFHDQLEQDFSNLCKVVEKELLTKIINRRPSTYSSEGTISSESFAISKLREKMAIPTSTYME